MKTAIVKFFSPLGDIYTLVVLAQSTFILSFIQEYVFRDWKFLTFLSILVVVDTGFGFYRAIKEKRVESKGWGKAIEKIFLYAGLLVTFHVLMYFTIDGEPNGWFDFVEKGAYTYMIVREAISIVEHASIIRPGMFPIWLLDRLSKYKDSGKLGDLVK